MDQHPEVQNFIDGGIFVDDGGAGEADLYDSDAPLDKQAINFYQEAVGNKANRDDDVRPILTRSPLGANTLPPTGF